MLSRKLRIAVRNQIELKYCCIDELVPEDHTVRLVWRYVEKLDLTPLLKKVSSLTYAKGAPATDPRILLALWLFATLDGIGSARKLDELCQRDLAYQWICGGVTMNYHTLATFRSGLGSFLDKLLTTSMAALISAGIVDISCIAVDSVRVRASAGQASFRREPTLLELQCLARDRIEHLKTAPEANSLGRRKAQERAARERAERIDAALAATTEIDAARAAEDKVNRRKTPKKRPEARASTTDPEARRMVLASGAIAPAYNLQIKTDPNVGAIIGVEVTNNGSDRGKLGAAVKETQSRYGVRPTAILADVGYDGHADIEAVETAGTAVYVPLPKTQAKGRPRQKAGPGVTKWKERMATDEAKAVYAKRIRTEMPHAQMRNHGLQQMPVRGLAKVKAVALLFAVASNFLLHGVTLLGAA